MGVSSSFLINFSSSRADRAYRKYMKKMNELGLVRITGSGRWRNYEIIM